MNWTIRKFYWDGTALQWHVSKVITAQFPQYSCQRHETIEIVRVNCDAREINIYTRRAA